MNTHREKKGGRFGFLIVVGLLVLIVFIGVTMWTNSRMPEPLTQEKLDKTVKGAAFIRANQRLIQNMEANWLPNDIFWPTLFLDNMPNFQIGELEVVRYNTRVLRDNLSRLRTTDKLDPWAEGAFTALSNDPYKWWFPSAESKWEKAYEDLGVFYENLLKGKSHFYPRADNLIQLLNEYASLMGGVNTRLINASRREESVLPIDGSAEKGEAGSTLIRIDIPWYKIDDNFYYAKGVAYALYESFKAVRVDFIKVLRDKNSLELTDKILEDLRRCAFEPWIVFNGSPDSVFANHSLNLSGVFNDARQKVYSLSVALDQG
ncbi:MAG: DUF2333 family protein [Deltaproteobacteria bacterium]|nr:DUF2333 family protein [Deltaproteobacteria bacterium]